MLGIIFHIFDVPTLHQGLVYKNNVLDRILAPGKYFVPRIPYVSYQLVNLPLTTQALVIPNQEVLTQDLISLRFSYVVMFAVENAKNVAAKFNLFKTQSSYGVIDPLAEAREWLHLTSQSLLRDLLSQTDSQKLNLAKNQFGETAIAELQKKVADTGIKIQQISIRDILFPKSIQEVFAKQLETKVRSTTDLENARTQVATSRALINAANIMREHPEIEKLLWLETLIKLSKTSGNTLVLNTDPNKFNLQQSSSVSPKK